MVLKIGGSDPEAWLDSWQADFVRAITAHYLRTGRVEAPRGWSQTPPALLEMCAEDFQEMWPLKPAVCAS